MLDLGRMSAVFFDMDGTLVDSETLTEPTVVALCGELGLHEVDIDCTQFFGGPWSEVERTLIQYYPQIDGITDISARLQELFHILLRDEQPPLIPGSRETVIALSKLMPVAIVTSSGRESAAEIVQRMGIADDISFYLGFEDYENGKPEPDGYLKAADALQVDPKKCLVFEDSIVGIQAAKNAGMAVVAVTHRCADIETATDLADMAIRDYSDLGEDFFDSISNSPTIEEMSVDQVIEEILGAYETGGDLDYGENISMREHMLQTACLAEQGGNEERIIVAALLHDYGHLVCDQPNNVFSEGSDNFHETVGARALESWFDEEIVGAIRLHVDAKRYLCAANPKYLAKLSDASITTLGVQGGPMNSEEMAGFREQVGYAIALTIRVYDDLGKEPRMLRPELPYYVPMLRRCLSAKT